MLRSYPSLRLCLLVGIAGGVPIQAKADIRLGDVVVSMPKHNSMGVVQYDFTSAHGTEHGTELRLISSSNMPPNVIRSAVSAFISDELEGRRIGFLQNIIEGTRNDPNFSRPAPARDRLFKLGCIHPSTASDCSGCPSEQEETRPMRGNPTIPKVHYGNVASGNSLIRDAVVRGEYSDRVGGALCFEMEAAGIMSSFPCLVIRGISDYADTHKNDDWQGCAAMAAAAYAKELLKRVHRERVTAEKLVSDCLEALGKRLQNIEENLGSDKADECRASFKTCNYESRKNVSPKAENGTCRWVLQNSQYIRWRSSQTNDLLWVSADPGCGKSVLSRFLVDEQLKEQNPGVTILYFFFKEGEEDSLARALCTLLHQLFRQQPELIDHAMEPWKSTGAKLKEEVEELWRIFQKATSDPKARSTICVLDALDECCLQDRHNLLTKLKDFFTKAQTESRNATLKFLLTSRPYNEIQNDLRAITSRFPHIHLQDEENREQIRQEINLVVTSEVRRLAQAMQFSSELEQRILEGLLRVENRTYLWVQLVIEYIRTSYGEQAEIESTPIPPLPLTVGEAYAKMLDRLPSDRKPKVKRIFQIIFAARRPLNTSEMAMAYGISDFDKSPPTRENATAGKEWIKKRFRSYCGLFVAIRDDVVYFFHQTAREFLIQKELSDCCFTLTEAETLWARICIRYLLLDEDESEFETSTNWGLLAEYSAINWASHVQYMSSNCMHKSEHDIYTLYRDHFNRWYYSFWGTVIPSEHICIREAGPLLAVHSAALNGHKNALANLIEGGEGYAVQADSKGTTALIWSSWAGQYEISKLLLSQGADVNATSKLYGTPLLVAALKGHKELVQLLLDNGAHIDQHCGMLERVQWATSNFLEKRYMTNHTGTALLAAALKGHLDVVQVLLQNGAKDLDFALMSACRGGNLDVVRLLVDKNADVNARDEDGTYGTPVQAAAMGGHAHILQYLFSRKASDERDHGKFETAINAAAYYGHGRVIGILLKHAPKDLYSNADYKEALNNALYRNDIDGVKALAPYVADEDIDAPLGSRGQSALSMAFKDCGPEIIMILLLNGANVNWCNPLVNAARLGYFEVAKFLIDHGADVDRGNPLLFATRNGHTDIVKLLVEKDADVDRECPLSDAARCGYVEIARLLTMNGADVDERCPLATAAPNGHVEIVELLIGEASDVSNGYPLSEAAHYGYVEIAKLLIDDGADVDEGYALLEAASAGHTEIVKLLLDNGADVGQGHPLVGAAGSGHVEIVELLIGAGADIDEGYPLHTAVKGWQVQTACILIDHKADVNALEDDHSAFELICALNILPLIHHVYARKIHIEGCL